MSARPPSPGLRLLTLLGASIFLIGMPLAAEQGTTVEVSVIWMDGDRERGVESTVYEIGSDMREPTDPNGKAVIAVSACNAAVRIAAEPQMRGLFTSESQPCDGSPLTIELSEIYSMTVSRILLDGETRNTISVAGPDTELTALTDACRGGDFRKVSQLAACTSFALRSSNPSIAQALSVISMDAGFRAVKLEPANPGQPLIGYDPGQDLYVMTPEGAGLYDHIISEKGVAERGRWTPRGIEAFTSWDREVDLDFRSEM